MHIWDVRMRVPYPAVLVVVRVRVAGRVKLAVRVLMVLIVHMWVRVRHRFVNVLMFVAFCQMQPHPHGHERARDGELHGDRFAEHNNRDSTSQKWCGGKVCAGARGPKMTQGNDEQGEAHAVSEKADDARQGDSGDFRERRANRKAKQEIERAGDKPFQFDDLQRIGKRDLARQVVVESPSQTRADNCKRTDDSADRRCAGPRQDRRARHKARHAESDAAVEVLMEHEPSHQCCCGAFKREEQGGSGSIGAGKAGHQEQRTDHATRRNRAAKPGQVGAGKRCFGRARQDRRQESPQDGDSHTRPTIE